MNKHEFNLSKARWIHIIPIVFITYSLAYVDRTNFGFAVAGGMAEDLNITSSMSSLLGSIFFLGYFCFQIPGAHYAEKNSAKKLIFWGLILWGLFSSLTGLVSNVELLLVIRFLLGVVESVVLPGLLVLLGHWFTKKERSKANTLLMLANPITILWMSILSGYLIQTLGWREMFFIEGFPSIIWAIVWWMLIKDKPEEAKWLKQEEKISIQLVLEREQAEIKPVPNYWAAFKSRNVLLLAPQYFLWNIGIAGFIMWLPTIIKDLSKSGIGETGLLSSVPYMLAIILMLIISYISDKFQVRKLLVWPCLVIGAITLYFSYALGDTNFLASFVMLTISGGIMFAPIGTFMAIFPEILPRNVSGAAIALVNSMGALGSFAGTYIVGYLNGITGNPGASFLLMAGALIVAAILTMFVKVNSNVRKVEQNETLTGENNI
ncbi:MFS transporter [Peribacillus muralis]|uniref:MFS transporter n=1 Tax=Peribacillus muralis TaxID=264697 RepID=UPI0007101E95|nr:MFS transporter [Peribacillus muralis]